MVRLSERYEEKGRNERKTKRCKLTRASAPPALIMVPLGKNPPPEQKVLVVTSSRRMLFVTKSYSAL